LWHLGVLAKEAAVGVANLRLQDEGQLAWAGHSDFTLYWSFDDLETDVQGKLWHQVPGNSAKYHAETVDDQITFEGLSSRACLCRCYGGKFLSGTLRIDDHKLPFNPDAFRMKLDHAKQSSRMVDNHEHGERLFQLLWPMKSAREPFHPQGLVIIAGATKSGKSKVAQALALRVILEYRARLAAALLERNKPDDVPQFRLPHLVTFEDPIEKWGLYHSGQPKSALDDPQNPSSWLKHGICFTPRRLEIDVSGLSQALKDARRQTPACFYVGEVRSKDDWGEIVDFAGSGHLVIATTHAGSLVEAMIRPMESLGITTAQGRRTFANNLLGCIHLRLESCEDAGLLLLPAVWRRQPDAINSLIAEGPSSIASNGKFVLGRHSYLTSDEAAGFRKGEKPRTWDKKGRPKRAVVDCALRIDLEEIVGK